MPPWAALEWERTGWTLLMIPTDTPSSAAASAARCPARPAPITRTSWEGTSADAIDAKSEPAVGIRGALSTRLKLPLWRRFGRVEPALAEPADRRLAEPHGVG